MRLAEWDVGSGHLDPTGYVDWLAVHALDLPPGARSYAVEPSHFDYYAFRTPESDLPPGTPLCTKDLLLSEVGIRGEFEQRLELKFLFPGHELPAVGTYDLILTYDCVSRFSLTAESDAPRREGMGLGHLMIDEVLPADRGIRHELAFNFGTAVIDAVDLEATWR